MVLPVLVLPFLTMIFWALGGGKGTPASAQAGEQAGLNLELPHAHFNDTEVWNKLSLYEQANRDSMKFQEARESDPYFDFAMLENDDLELPPQEPVNDKKSKLEKTVGRSTPKKVEAMDPNEAKVNQKLNQLMQELNNPEKRNARSFAEPELRTPDPQFSEDVQKLEQMMEMMSRGNQPDPEMQQIEGMLDKILDIQHPERVQEKIKEQSDQHQQPVFSVITVSEQPGGMDLPVTESPTQMDSSDLSAAFSVQAVKNSFYGLEEDAKAVGEGNAIEAVVHQTQELVAGATVKMRLLTDVFINGRLIEKNHFLYGVCAINGERLTIEINSIRNETSLLPVSLSVYDLDGQEGIYIPGAIARDVAKQSTDQAIQGLQFASMDQSLGAQAASAGIQAATGLFSKKVKLVKVTVKSGYKILLKDSNAH